MTNVISLKQVDFYFGKNQVLNQLNITVPKGSIYGFLGPNGSGKSTTMRLILGLIPSYGLDIELFNQKIEKRNSNLFHKVGALVETPSLYLHLTGFQNLKYIATIKGIGDSRIKEVLELVELAGASQLKVKKYSLGMKQRLAIASCLLNEPELLILDEPVNGLDPNGMLEVRNLLIKLNKENGVTVFISSHLLSEIEKLCTHIGIINNGKVKFEGTLTELNQKRNQGGVQLKIEDPENWLTKLNSEFNSIELGLDGIINLNDEQEINIPELVKNLAIEGAKIHEVRRNDNLEDWFLEITSNSNYN